MDPNIECTIHDIRFLLECSSTHGKSVEELDGGHVSHDVTTGGESTTADGVWPCIRGHRQCVYSHAANLQ